MDPEPLTEAELDLLTFTAMEKHGSPFFQKLGYALAFADLDQLNAIRLAFPHEWATFREAARREYAASQAQQMGGPVL